LANAVPLGGQTTGAISDQYVSMFTPAGFTFAIWGVIYLALLGFIIRQFWNRPGEAAPIFKIRIPFLVNCVANAAWILAWHYDQLILSMLIMVVILWTLIQINLILRAESTLMSTWGYLLIVLPFSIYFGWITVATIANVSVLQSAFGLNEAFLSQQAWTLLKLVAAGGAGYFWGWRYKQPAYLFVIAWAAFGISVANSSQSVVQIAAQILVVVGLLAGLSASWIRLKI